MAELVASFELQPKIPSLLHTAYYSNFFLLRTEITIDGERAQVGVNDSGWLTLNSRKHQLGITFDSLVTDVNSVLQDHGLRGVSNYWCEEVPLFELRGNSQDDLKNILQQEGAIQRTLETKIQSHISSIIGEEVGLKQPEMTVKVVVKVEPQIYLILVDQANRDGRPIRVTEDNFAECMALYGMSKLFDFGSIFRASHTKGDIEDFADLISVLWSVVNWYSLGTALEVPEEVLQTINLDNSKNDMRRNGMLTWWFNNGKSVTWPSLVNALSYSDMRLARIIAVKYGVPEPLCRTRASTISYTRPTNCHSKENSQEIARLDQVITKLRKDIEERDKQLERKTKHLDEAEREKQAISQQIERLTEYYSSSNSQFQELIRQKDEAERALKDMELQKEAQESENSNLRIKLKAVEQKLLRAKKQTHLVKEQLEKKSAELKEKSFEINCLQKSTNSMVELLNTERRVLDNYLMQFTAINISREKYDQEIKLQKKVMEEESENKIREYHDKIEQNSNFDTGLGIGHTGVTRSRSLLSLHRPNEYKSINQRESTDTKRSHTLEPLQWKQKKRAPKPLMRGAAAVKGDTVFVIGANSTKIHCYSLSGNEWKTVVQDCPHSNPGITIVEGVLTAFGGQKNGQKTTKVVSLKDERVWVDRVLPRMRYPHSSPSVLSHDSYIFVTGGSYHDEIPMVEVFAIHTWEWSKLLLLPMRLHDISTTVCDNTYVVINGSGSGYSIDLTSLLTLSKETKSPWKELSQLSTTSKPTIATFRNLIVAMSCDGVHQLTGREWIKLSDDKTFSLYSSWSKPVVAVVRGENYFEDQLVVIGGCSSDSDLPSDNLAIAF